jgi:hypothetical protein
MTRILPPSLDYTARDFDALGVRLERLIDSVFANWTDKSKASFANILKECVQFVGDVAGYYQDAHAIESRFVTATQRINGILHGLAIGYTFARQEAATADIQITLAQQHSLDVNIVEGSIVRTTAATDPHRFRFTETKQITIGNTQATVGAENSIEHTQYHESDDLAGQESLLEQIPFLDIVSVVDDVGSFTEVSNWLDSTSSDGHFVIRITEDGKGKLVFGDGNQGRIPSGTITIEYKTGGGGIVVEKNTLIVPEFQLLDTNNDPVPFSVTNPAAAVGGLEQESLASAQQKAPALLRVNQRSVTGADYAAVAATVAGVVRALMLTSDQMDGLPENYGHLYIVAQGAKTTSGGYLPAQPTTVQLANVESEIANEAPPTITFQFDAVQFAENVIDITARVRLRQGASGSATAQSILEKLEDYFAAVDADGNINNSIGFGFEYKDELGNTDARIPWSDIFRAVLSGDGVRSINEDTFVPANDVYLARNEYPVLGTVTIVNDRTGQTILVQSY